MPRISDCEDKSVNRPGSMPLPNTNPVELGMWQAAAKGVLAIQRCAACGLHRYPATIACCHCGSFDWIWDEIDGSGALVSFSWLPDHSRKDDNDWPSSWYNVAIVKLESANIENAHMVTNIVNVWHPGELKVGQKVRLHCVRLNDDLGLPCFELV